MLVRHHVGTSSHVDGRLTVRIGTVDEPEVRTIAIDTTASRSATEAEATESGDDQGPDQPTEMNATE